MCENDCPICSNKELRDRIVQYFEIPPLDLKQHEKEQGENKYCKEVRRHMRMIGTSEENIDYFLDKYFPNQSKD